ncbi:MAG: glycosyltransferase [Phycisphaerae bacterium]
MTDRIYIFAGGGTGGHLYPGLAVAEELTRIEPGAKIVFACSNREIDRRILGPQPYAMVPQPIRPLPAGPLGWWAFAKAYLQSAAQSRDMVRDLKPAAVLGLGGFAAWPLVSRAARSGVPSAMLNPDAVPGKANKRLAGLADAIFTQFERTAERFPPALRGKVRAVGCPIRPGLLGASRETAVRHFEIDGSLKTLLVFGASLGAATINEAMVALAPDLRQFAGKWQVLHVAGAGKGQGLGDAYKSAGIAARGMEYCDRMELAYAVADLALCRSGAGTVAELLATATPAVLMPYPYHRDRQQTHNAQPLADAGTAVICEDARDAAANAAILREHLLPLMQDEGALAKMRRSAAGIGKPYAARDVAQWLVQNGRPAFRGQAADSQRK